MTDIDFAVETAVDCRNVLGESPLWHPTEQCLYWIDIRTGELFRYDPDDSEHETVYRGDNVRALTVQTDGSLLIFMEDGTIRTVDSDGTTTVFDGIPGVNAVSYNDVVADPVGRVFCGVRATDDRLGRLYRLDTDGTFTRVVDEVAAPNGLGFSPDQSTLYFTDSRAYEIAAFAYDRRSGEITDRTVFASVSTDREAPLPDGLTVDADGYVWSAHFGAGIVRYTPGGQVAQRIPLPATTATSIGFGGPDYETLYVTTGTDGIDVLADPGTRAGALFRVSLQNVRGKPEFSSRIRV